MKDIKRKSRKQYSAEEKIRIVLDGLRGEDRLAETCLHEGISQTFYFKWSKDFLEAGKKRLAGDTVRQANTTKVKDLRSDAKELKECVAELTQEKRLLKKSMLGRRDDDICDILYPRSWRSSNWSRVQCCRRDLL